MIIQTLRAANTDLSGWDFGTVPEWFTALFAGAALMVVFTAVDQLRLHNRQLHRELENQYLQRFWTLWDRRTEKFKRTGRIKHADEAWIHDYLTLCKDQVELRELGRVTDDTWDFWARDMADLCFSYPELVSKAKAGYPELWSLLSHPDAQRAVEDRRVAVYDPLRLSRRKRRREGLT